jgi:hypothetical protein
VRRTSGGAGGKTLVARESEIERESERERERGRVGGSRRVEGSEDNCNNKQRNGKWRRERRMQKSKTGSKK